MQEDIAEQRVLSPVTVMTHLAKAMEAGYVVDYRRGVYVSMYKFMTFSLQLLWLILVISFI